MSVRRKITVAIVAIAGVVAAYLGGAIVHTVYAVRHVPEAYAAWDTGTLLVEYMKAHDDKWPSSWDELLSVMRSAPDNPIMFRGAQAGDTNYALTLRKKVAIDWKFDPARNDQPPPVTRLNGTKFPVLWQGANPNEIVRAYLKDHANTNEPKLR